ncbi:ATP-binding protein [Mesorhizobium sp. M2A.F.Ca.ET.043.05.1.1]|uniref:AlbA family DNA-binding domain-containing protein n=1 Tax=Mesorhizobium sp. M2A.F.Ca.ET.043.05.1.1 TaxID=2493671 RepID=UPI000F7620F1|nr:ATP-binding protein [Mesorhizobium sp. M2A.F.Ca.ET.043.05.1.1]AZO15522.1 ATP-binding protein [Mesorhizobium sp. M2A.F.Ca.ET.043.05.1.1]
MATIEDLKQLFQLQNETLATEFKSWLDLAVPAGRAPLAKAAIALANHGGGTIVIGMREGINAPIGSYPRPAQIGRYTADAINAAINKYADPHIHCDLVHLTHPASGNEHAIVIVPGGQIVPVMATKGTDGEILAQKVYIRKPGPKSEEPFTAEEWRTLLDRCVRANKDSLLEAIRGIVQGRSLDSLAREQIDELLKFTDDSRDSWKMRLVPLPKDDPARFPLGHYEQSFQILGVEPASGLRSLLENLRKASEVRLTGWGPFVLLERKPIGPVPVGEVIETWVGTPSEKARDGRHCDFWRARPDGFLYEVRSYDEDFTEKAEPGTSIDLTMPVWRIGETLLYVARLARLFGEDPEISVRIQYDGLKGRRMSALFDWRYLSYERECFVDTVKMQGQARASIIEDNLAEVLVSLLRPLYDAFDFAPLSPTMVSEEIAKFRNNRY